MLAPELLDEFRAFAAAPRSAVDGALLVGRVIDTDFDGAWCRAELARLAAHAGRDAHALIASLRAAGFGGASDYYVAGNSSLMQVLRRRRGIPISLAMVAVGVAEQRGMSASGINFPRHFLVQIEGELFDPFAMQATDRAACEAWLAANELDAGDAFRVAAPTDVVLRMLNNLRLLALAGADHARVLELSDCQLAVARDRLPIHLERIDSWLALGAARMAVHELDQAIALAPHAALRAELGARRATLDSGASRLH